MRWFEQHRQEWIAETRMFKLCYHAALLNCFSPSLNERVNKTNTSFSIIASMKDVPYERLAFCTRCSDTYPEHEYHSCPSDEQDDT